MGKNKTKGSMGKQKKGFQEVNVQGSASQRASVRSGKGASDSEDDVDAIRRANAAASVKRQKKAEQQQKKVEMKRVEKEVGKCKKEVTTETVRGKDRHGVGPLGKGKGAASSSSAGKSSARKVEDGEGKQMHKKRSREDEDEGDEGGDDDEESSSDEESEEDDDQPGLLMKPGAYADQRKGRNEFDEDSNEGSDFEELDVVFESFSPKEEDFHGIKIFLADLLDREAFDSSGLVDAVLEQADVVGTVVKVEGADEVFGIMSAVPMQQHRSATWAKQVQRFIASKCPGNFKSKLEKCVGSGDASWAFIVSERMSNMPQEMALPLLRGTFDEIKAAQKKKGGYKVENYVVLTRVLVEAQRDSGSSKGKGKKEEQDMIFIKAEDEVYASLSTLSFDFSLDRPADDGMSWRGLVCILPAGKVDALLKGVLEAVGDEAYRNQMD